jgi:hypothetical protein
LQQGKQCVYIAWLYGFSKLVFGKLGGICLNASGLCVLVVGFLMALPLTQ